MDLTASERNYCSGLLKFFYHDNTHVDLIRRLTGLLLLVPCILGIALFVEGQPYFVPAWRIGTLFFRLPQMPLFIYIALWAACAACGLLLMWGKTSKIFLIIPAVAIAFLGTCEYTCIIFSYFILTWLFIIALLFHREPHSCTRTIIQLSIASCYFFSVLEKLHPEWLDGSTIYQIVTDGWELRPQFVFIKHLGISHEAAGLLAIATVCTELFLSVAMFFKVTRNIAFLAGIIMHLAMAVLLQYVEIFSITMLVGYLAFHERQPKQFIPQSSVPRTEALLILAVTMLIVWMPLRFYLLSDLPITYLSFSDRLPWSFAMFLFHEELEDVTAKYLGIDNRWQSIQISERMTRANNISEIYALAEYIGQCHPEAVEISVSNKLTINGHWTITKLCHVVCHDGTRHCQLTVISRRGSSVWQGLARGSDTCL